MPRTPNLRRSAAECPATRTDTTIRSGDTPEELAEWLGDAGVPGVPPAPEPHQVQAAGEFADEVRRGKVPGIRPIKRRLGVGQPKAQEVQAYLEDAREPVALLPSPGAAGQQARSRGRSRKDRTTVSICTGTCQVRARDARPGR